MKTLYIIRHAQSSPMNSDVSDFDRPLNKRWELDAEMIWKRLNKKNIYPDIIYSSSAKRAKQTCRKISKEIIYNEKKIIYKQKIYDNHINWIDFYLWFIMEIKNIYNEVFLIWHNNVWSEIASYLLWQDIGILPTCWVISISFNIKSWDEVWYSNGKLWFFISPKTEN